MSTAKRFVTKNGLDNNNNSITNLGTAGSSLALSGAFAGTFTLTGTTGVTFPTSGTLATTTQLNSYVLKAGDTMTGNLTVSKTLPEITIDTSTAADFGRLIFTAAGSTRWVVGKNSTSESGSNVGSDYYIQRFTDAGAAIDTAFTIQRSTGNVGIGVITPATVLHVKEDQSSATLVRIENANTGTGAYYGTGFSDGTTTKALAVQLGTGFTTSNQYVQDGFALNTGGTGGLSLAAADGAGVIRFYAGGVTERMRIDTTGNVGIGAVPGSVYMLDVYKATDNNVRIRAGTSAAAALYLAGNNNVAGSTGMYVMQDSSSNCYVVNGATGALILGTSGAERMRITATGDVGIATTPTAGYRLHVSGDSLFSSIKIHASDAISRVSAGAIYIGYENANNLIFATTTTSGTGTERLRITGAGGVSFGTGGVSYGTTGQSLVSAGNAPPTWTNNLIGTLSDTTSYRIVNPGGGHHMGSSSVYTGAMKITLPVGMTNQMFRMTIKCYEYITNESFEIHVGGYNYSVGNTWANSPFAYIIGNPNTDRRFTVRFGYTGAGKGVIYVGELASTWSYLNYEITDVLVGYSGTGTAWASGWVLGFEPTAFENVTASISDCQVGYQATANIANSVVLRDGSGNFTAGTITATVFNATSTADVKGDIVDISESYLDRFDQLRPREYNRTDYTAHEFGFIAEEMETIYPEVVGKNADGKPTGIDYGKLSTILTAKVQQQQSVINNLQDQVAKIMELLQGIK